jgi:hypothetical protein
MYKATIGVVLGVSKTGQSLKAQLVSPSGTLVGSLISSGFVEIGQGNYMWTYDQFPASFRGGVKFFAGNNLMAFMTINPELLEYVDAPISSRLTSAIKVPTFSIPVVADEGTPVVFRQTDDYFASEGRSIDVSSEAWPPLAEAVVRLTVKSKKPGFIKVLPVLPDNTVRLELSSAELAQMGSGRWPFEINTRLANDHLLTLLKGIFSVTAPFN